MKGIFNYIFYIIVVVLIMGIILYPSQTSEAVTESLKLCVGIVIPSLFPFFVLSSVLIYSGCAKIIGRWLRFVMTHLFNLPGSTGVAFFLGILSGYPVGANAAIGLYKSGQCTKVEAERLLAFCNNSGPAFVLGSVGVGIWHSGKIGFILYGCHVLSSIIVGILLSFKSPKVVGKSKESHQNPPLGIYESIVTAVKDTAKNMVYITSFVVFFGVVTRLFTQLHIIPLLSEILSRVTLLPTSYANNVIEGLMEITAGIYSLGGHSGNVLLRLALTNGLLSFAGLCVHCQVLSIISGSGLSAKLYIIGKSLQSVIAAFMTYFVCKFVKLDTTTAVSVFKNINTHYTKPYYFACFIILLIPLLFTIKKRVEKSR